VELPHTEYSVRRLKVSIRDVLRFQTAYEHAVPDAPVDEVSKLVAAGRTLVADGGVDRRALVVTVRRVETCGSQSFIQPAGAMVVDPPMM